MTTPYPGSRLYNIAQKYDLVPKDSAGNWELFDSGSNFVMKLPGIKERDWLEVLNAGKRLQAKLLITSGTFNFSAFPLYIRKGVSLLKMNMGRLLSRFSKSLKTRSKTVQVQ